MSLFQAIVEPRKLTIFLIFLIFFYFTIAFKLKGFDFYESIISSLGFSLMVIGFKCIYVSIFFLELIRIRNGDKNMYILNIFFKCLSFAMIGDLEYVNRFGLFLIGLLFLLIGMFFLAPALVLK